MTDNPFMPKATAVWLVENTTLTFKQIAQFCNLHELEIKVLLMAMSPKVLKPITPFWRVSSGNRTLFKRSK